MIVYDKMWKMMKLRNITQYDLYTKHNVNRAQIQRLKNNQNIQTATIDKLCNLFQCDVEEIMEHIHDNNIF